MDTTRPLVIIRTFDAPVKKVWAAWTEPEIIKKWWGPEGFTAPAAEVDLRVGGKYLFCMRGKAGPDLPVHDYWNTGIYEEIEPMKRLVYLDSFANEHGDVISPEDYGLNGLPKIMRVRIEFEALPDGTTQVVITHDGASDDEQARNMELGWHQSLDKMAESLN